MKTNRRPWTTSPKELLEHARGHLVDGSDFDKRIALISIDNAVELMISAFLEQPARVLGFKIPRRRIEEARSSFPSLLDALEEFATDRLQGIDLSDIEWFHRLRNQLYHGGIGLTVESQKVVVYMQLAETLFDTLFGVQPDARPSDDTVARFLASFNELMAHGAQLADLEGIESGYGYQRSYLVLSRHLHGYDDVRRFRNDLVHSTATKTQEELEKHLRTVSAMVAEMGKRVAEFEAEGAS
ncbi:hypothetical protein JYT44_02755 [Caldithrix abyssi]|nr:hypothetical protein [Caldithrix abyssi]